MAQEEDYGEGDVGDEEEDRDLPLESDVDDSDEPDLMPCPHCRKMITEDHEICPHCRNFISAADMPRRAPIWLLVGAGVAILGFVITYVMRGR